MAYDVCRIMMVPKASLLVSLFLCCITASACSLLEDEPERSEHPIQRLLDENIALWNRQRPSNYEYVLENGCYCLPEYYTPVLVEVRADTLYAMSYIPSHRAVGRDVASYLPVIDTLFSQLQQAIDMGRDSIYVQFDAEYGFPYNVFIDWAPGVDDEQKVEIRWFKAVDGGGRSMKPYNTALKRTQSRATFSL